MTIFNLDLTLLHTLDCHHLLLEGNNLGSSGENVTNNSIIITHTDPSARVDPYAFSDASGKGKTAVVSLVEANVMNNNNNDNVMSICIHFGSII